MKQTAVEWLMQTLEQNNIIDLDVIDSDKYYTIIEQAKEMEKQQRDEFAIAFAEYVLDWNRDTTSDYLQIILEQFKNK